ncbi:MAG: peptidylprolyl isomerase [Patescibacteria group bacterium]
MDFDQPKNIVIGLVILVAVFGVVVWAGSRSPAPTPEIVKNSDQAQNINNNATQNMNTNEIVQEKNKATIKTAKGSIIIDLYPKAAPKTVAGFIEKSKAGYFNGLKFHRVEDWVLQGGDPLSRDESKKSMWGTGGGNIETELSQMPFVIGAVGVARGGDIKISNDSQFFVVKKDAQFLNGQYTLFGQVTQGMDVVQNMTIGDTIQSITIE